MLLRIAIGWHFTYEGLYKIDPPEGAPPFSAEGYFRGSAGPLAPTLRSLLDDPDARVTLGRDEAGLPSGLRQRWAEDLQRYAAHYNFSDEQRRQAEEALEQRIAEADLWFRDLDNKQKVDKYFADLDRVESLENDPEALAYQAELAYRDRRALNERRRDLLQPINAWTSTLHDAWQAIATEDQVSASGEYVAPWSRLDWINALTMYGLLIAGVCLMLGLLTPLAALWCAGFLAMIYLCNPPWPWLPEPPISEGHYRFVDKNLIEMLACLVLASTPSGLWVGLDALLFGWYARRRAARRAAREAEREALETA